LQDWRAAGIEASIGGSWWSITIGGDWGTDVVGSTRCPAAIGTSLAASAGDSVLHAVPNGNDAAIGIDRRGIRRTGRRT
jgi:hypothetical protein